MKTKIYIDGQSGTTGLQIYDRIGSREDLELLRIPEDKRHDTEERKKYLNSADIVFLCLPDDGAREAVSLIDNDNVRVIDASTAHRTNDDWVYGFPEFSGEQREAIRTGKRIANPGCHATGFISVTAPLVRMGILPKDYPVTCYSLTGYSGGGKKMIADYEAEGRDELLSAPGIYGLSLKHKHIPEMQKMTGLMYPPVFMPVVDDYYKGMATTIMLQNRLLNGIPTAEEICGKLMEYYKDECFVKVVPFGENDSKLYANRLAGTNELQIVVCGYEDQTTVTALFDNLGKGASGAAVQNMNIMLGLPEDTGL
ncbi:N-acetyl-gamma-glutamyl-phosphate reductase [Oribacterium sp. WCC10]|uniref:N-acetyl-gamma-glutamyl-phosphate reductase n=1 Tax=Oribacterium sp. WCC10 TaxID=1855343 RepID=UPI0008E4A377|nr:N-acetyl-gamma-glutamyl-phosphate reductase [Oribacterium sp. WCC10]SFG16257.1 N-acetyl-gamma-glutamyl-phosphate reductase [Oribacterium sp. WCC10]